ncbi:krab-a domain-containing protein [Vespula squamosa]|uniref:Krab-a domain-containing protein n=1 Tax=Vespula squamosa TaxID=30214 RepID=A0ABD2BXT1_VESSQ
MCTFLLNTSSDVFLISPRFVDCTLKRSTLTGMRLPYLIGKVLLTKGKIESLVELKEFSEKIFFVIVDITDDCILECDFLVKTGLDKQFRKIEEFGSEDFRRENSGNLSTEQKEDFFKLLYKLSEEFAEDIFTRNCGINMDGQLA